LQVIEIANRGWSRQELPGFETALPSLGPEWAADLRELVSLCLTRDPLQRPSAERLLAHRFFARVLSSNQQNSIPRSSSGELCDRKQGPLRVQSLKDFDNEDTREPVPLLRDRGLPKMSLSKSMVSSEASMGQSFGDAPDAPPTFIEFISRACAAHQDRDQQEIGCDEISASASRSDLDIESFSLLPSAEMMTALTRTLAQSSDFPRRTRSNGDFLGHKPLFIKTKSKPGLLQKLNLFHSNASNLCSSKSGAANRCVITTTYTSFQHCLNFILLL
jgi:serine/threonine protein kinase